MWEGGHYVRARRPLRFGNVVHSRHKNKSNHENTKVRRTTKKKKKRFHFVFPAGRSPETESPASPYEIQLVVPDRRLMSVPITLRSNDRGLRSDRTRPHSSARRRHSTPIARQVSIL